MTQPTQAQIEAVAKAICDHRHYPDTEAWMNLGELQDNYRTMAEAALTAAAQVGEPEDWIEKRRAIRQSAIERCAQVADEYTKGGEELGTSGIHIKIAAAIRKLKDAP